MSNGIRGTIVAAGAIMLAACSGGSPAPPNASRPSTDGSSTAPSGAPSISRSESATLRISSDGNRLIARFKTDVWVSRQGPNGVLGKAAPTRTNRVTITADEQGIVGVYTVDSQRVVAEAFLMNANVLDGRMSGLQWLSAAGLAQLVWQGKADRWEVFRGGERITGNARRSYVDQGQFANSPFYLVSGGLESLGGEVRFPDPRAVGSKVTSLPKYNPTATSTGGSQN